MKTHTFNGQRYAIETDMRIGGYAETPNGRVVPELYVDPTLKGLRHLDIAVHEAMHAAFNAAPEEVVAVSARDVARFLWRLGYRRKV